MQGTIEDLANSPELALLQGEKQAHVAISRAKFGLVLVCDPRALMHDAHWAACVAYAACLGGLVLPSADFMDKVPPPAAAAPVARSFTAG